MNDKELTPTEVELTRISAEILTIVNELNDAGD